MWRQRKKWIPPKHPWKRERLEEEKKLKKYYGLKNKREIWKAETLARNARKYARELNAKKAAGFDISEDEKKFLNKLYKYGLVDANAKLTDVLEITTKDVLERRLQTIVWRKGLAKTVKQARQFIVHGHIMVGDKVVTSPGYLVKREEEDLIKYHPTSPLADENHPMRLVIEGKIIQQEVSENQQDSKDETATIESGVSTNN